MKQWDLVMMICLLFTAVLTPFEVAFLQTTLDLLFIINRVVDALFACDLVMQFFLAYMDSDGQWVVEHDRIASRYLVGWFWIDLVSILPFDTIGIVLGNDEISRLAILRGIRLLRLFKLFRLVRASRIFSRW